MVPLDSSVFDESQDKTRSYYALGNLGQIKRIIKLELDKIDNLSDTRYYSYVFEEKLPTFSESKKCVSHIMYYIEWLKSLNCERAINVIKS